MKRIYDFSRTPAQRNYTVADLKALKGSGKTLTMCNPADRDQIIACVEAGIDLFVVGTDQMEDVRELALRISQVQGHPGRSLDQMMKSLPMRSRRCDAARICITRCALLM
jgi:hypothetical protein